MLLEIDHHSGVPIYRQVVRQIRRHIMTDGLKEGEQLETVRDLAARLKVNPMTIKENARVLRDGPDLLSANAAHQLLFDVLVPEVKEVARVIPDKAVLFDGLAVAANIAEGFTDQVVVGVEVLGEG